ncbi:MAG: prpI [Actinomycetia bacterium]|nr:prpI [Actinomycetes bacterium]
MSTERAELLGALGWPALGDALGRVPAPVAVTSGPGHELAYANDAYTREFGAGAYPRLGGEDFLSVLDGVYRSGLPYQARSGDPLIFVFAPLRAEGAVWGVLVIAIRSGAEAAAAALHRTLVPLSPPDPEDLDVVAHPVPGTSGSPAGGSWHDVITLGAGRTALVAADPPGDGGHPGAAADPAAAHAVTAQARAALRAYARLDLPPAEVLEQAGAVLADLAAGATVNASYTVFDPAEASITAASAGQAAPLVLYPDGFGERLKLAAGPPLGAVGEPSAEVTALLPDGATLVLLTGGLAGALDPAATGELALATPADPAAPSDPVSLDALCRRIAARLAPEHAPDGGTLLLIRRRSPRPGHSGARMIELALSDGQEPTRRARAFCHGALATWRVPDQQREDIVLVVSELVTNAVVHGEAARRLRLRRTGVRIVVEVFDSGHRMPHPRAAALDAESGRGLHLVAKLADRWGARPVTGGKVVWCEFDHEPAPGRT